MSDEIWKTCQSQTEDGVQCEIPAHFSYVWPGKPRSFACIVHADGIQKVAAVIGCPIFFEPYQGEIR